MNPVIARNPAQKRTMNSGKAHIDVLPRSATDVEPHFIQIVAMPHHDEVISLGKSFCGMTPVDSSQVFHPVRRKFFR